MRRGSGVSGDVFVLGDAPIAGMVAFTAMTGQPLIEVLVCVVPTPGQTLDLGKCLNLLLSSGVWADLIQL